MWFADLDDADVVYKEPSGYYSHPRYIHCGTKAEAKKVLIRVTRALLERAHRNLLEAQEQYAKACSVTIQEEE